jgi:hypothetical protein
LVGWLVYPRRDQDRSRFDPNSNFLSAVKKKKKKENETRSGHQPSTAAFDDAQRKHTVSK